MAFFTSLVKPSSKIMNIANLTNKEDITDNIPFLNQTDASSHFGRRSRI